MDHRYYIKTLKYGGGKYGGFSCIIVIWLASIKAGFEYKLKLVERHVI